MNNKEYSPFTPGSPVPVELFVGRKNQIEEILRYLGHIKAGRVENIFLAGDRGIGKSSLASFLCNYVNARENILGIHVFLGRVSTLEEMVRHIFEEILKETRNQDWFKTISGFFGKYVREIGLLGISISFNPPETELRELVRNFPEALYNLIAKIPAQKQGLFIALDDINGLVEKKEFANWYKSIVDEIATKYSGNFPVFFMLIGLPEKRDILSRNQPSLMRIFRVIEINKLSNEEVGQFFSQAFRSVGMKADSNAMHLMVKFSSGLPILMHEIGDSTFWVDKDSVIDKKDVIKGVLLAAEKVGQKYLDPGVYRVIRSPRYRSILRKLGERPLSRHFSKKDVEAKLNNNEKKVFHNFLRRIRELGVIEPDIEQGRGAYRFVNEIYPICIWMESERFKDGK